MKKHYFAIACVLYAGLSLFAQTTTTFSYTGSMQTFTVPACVTSITFDVRGARGGGDTTVNAPGGRGGRVQCTYPVTPGQVLNIYVGGQGGLAGSAGYNGGGLGANGSPGAPGGGGGGASDIRINGTTLNDRVIVAGGGGGGCENGGASNGGGGGGLIGGTGGIGGNPWGCTPLTAATGGTQSAGGAGGTSTSCAWNGSNGSFGAGGNGYPVYRCAGGGGGWYGGGGAHNGCSGGGGSSYTDGLATAVTHTQGYQYGDGLVILTYNAGPAAPGAISGNDSVCIGSSGTYTIAPVPGATSYTWSVPAGTIINSGQSTTSINITAGSTSGAITVFATAPCGNSTPTTFSLAVSAYPVVYGTATDSSVCPGSMTTLNGSGAVTYSWSGGVTDGVPFTPPASGTYTVIGTNAFGCDDTAAISITVLSNPVVSLGPDVTQCGDTVCLDAGNPGSAYTWSNGDTTQVSCVMMSGTYSVQVNDVNGCNGYDTITVTLNPLPAVQFMMPMIFACADDDSIPMTATPAGGVFSGPGVFGNTFSPSAAGQGYHIITYTYTDSLGCTGMDTSAIFVDLCLNVTQQSETGTTSLFPNPNSGRMTFVSHSDLGEITIEFTDVQGRVVYTSTVSNATAGYTKTIDLSGLADGIYMMHITGDSINEVKQVTIQR